MTDVQYRVLQNRAARTAQKYRLKVEKSLNFLQAKLGAIAKSKAIVSPQRYSVVFAAWDTLQASLRDLERALADIRIIR